MLRPSTAGGRMLLAGLFGLAYFAFARLGLLFVAEPSDIAPVWPAAGFALAGLLLCARRDWPALLATIATAGFAANLVQGTEVVASLGFAAASAAESVLAAGLLLRFGGSPFTLGSLRQVLCLIGVAAVAANAATALLGAAVTAQAFGAPYWESWLRWWAGDVLGMLAVAPVVLVLATPGAKARSRISPGRTLEAGLLLAGLALTSIGVFASPFDTLLPFLDFPYAVLPFVVWAGLRFGISGAAFAGLMPAVAGVAATLGGRGPFSDPAHTAALQILQLQAFLLVAFGMALLAAAVMDERMRAQAALVAGERRSRRILEGAREAFVSIDADGIIRAWNPQAERTFGWSRDEAVGRLLAETIIPERFREAHRTDLRRFQETGRGALLDRPIELIALARDGHELPVELMLSAHQLPDGWAFNAFIRDVSERKQAEAALRLESEITANMAEGACLIHAGDGLIVYTNPTLEWMYGYAAGELAGRHFSVLYAPTDKTPAETAAEVKAAAEPTGAWTGEVLSARKDGTTFWRRANASSFEHPDHGRVWVSVHTDISKERAAQDALREAEERFRHAFEDAGTGLALVGVHGDDAGRLINVNQALCELTGYPRDKLLGLELTALTHAEEVAAGADGIRRLMRGEISRFQIETRVLGAGGEVVWISLSTSLVRGGDGAPLYRVAEFQDVTERKRVEGQLQHLADHDHLTGLFNRRRIESELSRELSAARRYGTGGAVLVLDLDNFKYVNDSLGHAAGDELIGRMAQVIRARLRASDILGRLGGDEFAVILPHADRAAARGVAATLLDAIRVGSKVTTDQGSRQTSASIGIALFSDEPGKTTEGLLAEADRAMYDAKEAGRDQITVSSGRADANLIWRRG